MPPSVPRSQMIGAFILSGRYEVRSGHAIAMDDLVVHSIFTGVSTEQHVPQTLGVAFEAPGRALDALYQVFESKKEQFLSDNGVDIVRAVRGVANILHRDREQHYFRGLLPGELTLLTWCMAVYALLLGPQSPVRLLSVPMGQDRRYGFGIFARQKISAGTELWDVFGLMPTDDSDPHSDLSIITVAPGQNQRPGSSRILFGPMRMLNHRCKTFNCEFVSRTGTSMYVLHINRDIAKGEELTVDYGPEWFGGDCPCFDCTGPPTSFASTSTPPLDNTTSPALLSLKEREALVNSRNEKRTREFRENRKREAEQSKSEKRERKRAKQAQKRRKAKGSVGGGD